MGTLKNDKNENWKAGLNGDIKDGGYLKQTPQYEYLFPSSIVITLISVIVIINISSNLSSIPIPLISVSRKSIYIFFL